MRVTMGSVAVLGLAVAAASAQPVKERAAALKPPQALAPGELPRARGASEELPPSLSGTPVKRASGPAWLTDDAGVVPAVGTAGKSNAVRPLGLPPALGRDEPIPPPPKMLDRLRVFPGEKPAAPVQPVAQAQPQPAPQPQPQPTAQTGFRGTGANGAPVYAGPPAYRWYGWGTVTPGANPLAPAGQYPKASANWYSITGATPGAFPVPVTDAGPAAPGIEPPSYGLAARTPPPLPVAAQPAPAPVERPEPSKFAPPAESKSVPPGVGALPPPSFGPPAVPVPALTPPPLPKSAAAIAPTLPPPSVPLPPLPPVVVAPPPAPVAAPKAEKAEPVAALPPPSMPLPAPLPPVAAVAPPAIPPVVPPVAPAAAPTGPVVAPTVPVAVEPPKPAPLSAEPKPAAPTPAALPTSVTADPPRDEPKWKQSAEPAAPRPGTWAPAAEPVPLPTVPVTPSPAGFQTGRGKGASVVARAQNGDATPDPVDALVKQVCQGRATDVEIRHTGTKKIQVCFEVKTAEVAKALVADISKRPELTAYQIDFCVLVK